MADPDGIQKEQLLPELKRSGIQPPSSPSDVPASVVQLKKCPHCDKSLTTVDVAGGRCWYCNKHLADPVEPKHGQTPFLATFLFGLFGAILGLVLGYMLTGDKIGQDSWTVSLCGGIGFATGSALARTIFHKQPE